MIDEKEIIKLNLEGKTNSEIRKALGYSLTTIAKYLAKNELSNNYTSVTLLPKILNLHNLGKTNLEISNELEISKTTTRKYLTEYLNKCPNSSKRKPIKEKISLTSEQLELIYGSLLGDLSIDRSHKVFRIAISQGGKQEEYFDYKCSILSNILGSVVKKPRYDNRTHKSYVKLCAKTLSNKVFNEIADKIYINGVKTITEYWLSQLTPRGLAYWFMDDGHKSGTLATNCFSIEEVELIKKWFKNRYDMEVTIQLQKGIQPLIYFPKPAKKKFYSLTKKYFLPSMLYKIESWNP